VKEKPMKRFKLDPKQLPELSEAQKSRLDAMSDKDIDYSDIPDITVTHREAIEKLYRPIKQTVTIRLDADVVSWLKRKYDKYQTAVNHILREHMNERS